MLSSFLAFPQNPCAGGLQRGLFLIFLHNPVWDAARSRAGDGSPEVLLTEQREPGPQGAREVLVRRADLQTLAVKQMR